MRLILTVIAASFMLSACITTSVKSYSDSDFKATRVSKILIDLSQMPPSNKDEVEAPLLEKMKLAGVAATPIFSLIPPTKEYSAEQVKALIMQGAYDAILTIQITGDKSQSTYVGSTSYTNINAYAYGSRVNANANGFSTPIVAARGVTNFRATLFDPATGKKIWVADLSSEAKGTAFVGKSDKIAADAADALVKKLKEDGKI